MVANFDVAPTNPAAPPRAKRLEHRFLRRPSAGVVLRRGALRRAVGDFVIGVDPANEDLAVTFDHLGDAEALDDVGADANDASSHD